MKVGERPNAASNPNPNQNQNPNQNPNQVPDQNPPPDEDPQNPPPLLFLLYLTASVAPGVPQRPQLNWSHFKPRYTGKPDEDAEAQFT